MSKKLLLVALTVLVALVVLAACSTATPEPPTAAVQPTSAPPPATQPPAATPVPPGPTAVPLEIPYLALWQGSPHNDTKAEAFNHWNTPPATPGAVAEVPSACARCHSTTGYQDYLGADGSEVGKVDKNQPIGQTIQCVACHNEKTLTLSSVTFPSGLEVTGLGREARCMVCHQGRASTQTVLDSIAKAGLKDDDTVSPDLGFTNIHYLAAAASLYGTFAQGGFQYEGKLYDAKFKHVSGYDTCIGCHNPHTLELKLDQCATCHTNVKTKDDLKNIRMMGSLVDYNGNGDTKEGIYLEVDGLRTMLLQAMQTYAKEVSKTPLAYTPDVYPYFVIDTNGNGTADADEAKAANKYNAWTGRLAKAAYNYQTSIKDPGSFAHGGKYMIELLYDSIESLNEKISTPIDLSKAHRTDAGHFNGSAMPFRDWDETGIVPAGCVRCHAPTGLPMYVKEGSTVSQPAGSGLMCVTCHDNLQDFKRIEVKQVTFPSGKVVDSGDPDTNLCMTCHQGRESTASVDKAIKGLDLDVVSDKISFRNIHYFAAGATLYGNDAQGAYQYADKDYLGFNSKHPLNQCAKCHNVHELEVQVDKCAGCHTEVKTKEDLRSISMNKVDYDGNGTTDPIAVEFAGMQDKLYTNIVAYAKEVSGKDIVYDAAAYPYYFVDTNGDGKHDATETDRYASWTPRLLTAAFNYQYSIKDPGAFAHNGQYVIQVMYDSIASLNEKVSAPIDMTTMVRPVTPAP
jgi:hypothetical protein